MQYSMAVLGSRKKSILFQYVPMVGFMVSRKENKTPGKMGYGGVETYGNDRTFQETPNTQTAVFKYADGTILEIETRNWYTNAEGKNNTTDGNIFYGTEGIYGIYRWLESFPSKGKATFCRCRVSVKAKLLPAEVQEEVTCFQSLLT